MFALRFTTYSLTPYILTSFAALWAYSWIYALSLGLPISEWFSPWAFSNSAVVQGFIWPVIFTLLHLVSALSYGLRARAPRFEFLSYVSLFSFMAGVAIYYFVVHGFSIETYALPWIILLNLPPLALIIFHAHQTRSSRA